MVAILDFPKMAAPGGTTLGAHQKCNKYGMVDLRAKFGAFGNVMLLLAKSNQNLCLEILKLVAIMTKYNKSFKYHINMTLPFVQIIYFFSDDFSLKMSYL